MKFFEYKKRLLLIFLKVPKANLFNEDSVEPWEAAVGVKPTKLCWPEFWLSFCKTTRFVVGLRLASTKVATILPFRNSTHIFPLNFTNTAFTLSV